MTDLIEDERERQQNLPGPEPENFLLIAEREQGILRDQLLADAEARFRGAYENTAIGIAFANLDGLLLDVNSTYCAMSGYSRDELLRTRVADLIYSDDRGQHERLIEQLKTQAIPSFVIENRFVRKDGQPIWVRRSVSTVFAPDGTPKWFLALVEDVDAQHKAAQALETSERIYRAIGESMPFGVWITDENGVGTYASQSMLDMLGVTLDQFINMGWAGMLHPDDAARVAPAWREFIRTNGTWDAEFRIRGKDGQYHPIWGRGLPVRDDDGKIIAWAGVNLDISSLKKTEEELRNSEKLYRAIGESIAYGIWTTDAQGRNTYTSQSMLELLGLTQEQASELGWTHALHPDDVQRITAAWQECVRIGGNWDTEYRYRDPQGAYHPVLSRGVPVRNDDGRIIAWAGINLDIGSLKKTEEDLRNSQHIYRAIGETIPFGIWICEPDGKAMYASQSMLDMLGFTMEQFRDFGWGDALLPEDTERITSAWREHILNPDGPMWDMEHPFRGKDGQIHYVLGRGVPVRDERGQLLCWAGINLDITNLKKTEEQLRKSQHLYRAIGESIPFGIWICDPDGRNTYASQSLLDLLGITQEQCSEFGWGDALHPDDAERTIAAWKECVRTEGVWSIEHRYRGVDGKYHPILARGVPVRDDDGKIIAWAGINLDISDLKQTEEELRISRDRFVLALRNSPILVSTQDTSLRYTWIYNPALGRSAEDVIGKTYEEFGSTEHGAALTAMKRSVLESGTGQRQEVQLPGADGMLHTFDTTVEPLRDAHGLITGLTTVAVDITRSKQQEQQIRDSQVRLELHRRLLDQREQERASLAREVHDGPVQTLAALNMELDLLARKVKDPETRRELSRMRRELKAGMQELRDMVGELRSAQLQAVGLTHAIRMHAEEFNRKHAEIALTCKVAPDRRRLGMYGSLALFRIYQEALSNVAKHSQATKVSVTLRFTREHAILSVRDNGKGMEGPADLIDQTTRGRYGLAGMQERADAVSGKLEIRSRPGKGTTVIAAIPLEQAVEK